MITPAAAPSASPSPAGRTGSGAVLTALGGNPAIPGTFADLLAAGTDTAPLAPTATKPAPMPPVAQPMADAARQDLAAGAAVPLPAGKVLPDLLPGLAASADPKPALPEAPHPANTRPAPLLAAVRTIRGPAQRETDEVANPATPSVPADADGAPELAAATLDASILPFAQAPATPLRVPAEPTQAPTATPQAAPTAPTPPPSAGQLPPPILAQLRGEQLLRPADTKAVPAPAPAPATDERNLRLPVAAAVAGAVPFTLASPAAPAAPTALHLRPVLDKASEPAPQSADAAPAPAAPSVLTAPAADPQAPETLARIGAPAATPAHQTPGDSFTAVVDRLMAARDGARADSPVQPVAVNLHHAEFGEVSVRFEHRADGLSVALASPDPDFARAVQAA
ncbi:MAG: hypothetical protein KGL54_14205, partial [Sphingomonadales bacterium]|nr:hypothetical protein [Sphingomonadales bacterium]